MLNCLATVMFHRTPCSSYIARGRRRLDASPSLEINTKGWSVLLLTNNVLTVITKKIILFLLFTGSAFIDVNVYCICSIFRVCLFLKPEKVQISFTFFTEEGAGFQINLSLRDCRHATAFRERHVR